MLNFQEDIFHAFIRICETFIYTVYAELLQT